MKVTIIKKEANPQKETIFSSIVLLILGILLLFYSSGILTILFSIIGGIIVLLNIYQLVELYKNEKETKIVLTNEKNSAIMWIVFGFIIIFLSSFFANAVQLITGIWFLFLGSQKLSSALYYRQINSKLFLSSFIGAILLFFFGIYTIIAENIVFIFLGIVLIIYAIFDLISAFKTK